MITRAWVKRLRQDVNSMARGLCPRVPKSLLQRITRGRAGPIGVIGQCCIDVAIQ